MQMKCVGHIWGEESERRFLLASLKKQGWGIKQLEQQQLYLLSYHPAH